MHAISSTWDEPFPKDALMGDLLKGSYRTYTCFCGQPLPDYAAAQLHAIETDQCSACLGRTRISMMPGIEHGCGYCNLTGTRDAELAEQMARGKVEAVIDEAAFMQAVEAFQGEEFTQVELVGRLTELAPDATTPQLSLRAGHLMRVFARKGVLMQVSAPSSVGGDVVQYDNPRWKAASGPLSA